MKDENWRPDGINAQTGDSEPTGVLQRALYLWERQLPSESLAPNTAFKGAPTKGRDSDLVSRPDEPDLTASSFDFVIEERLKRQASRLAALERFIPGEKRLDSPRFSLMMLNAFLGRAVTEGLVSARLPGLSSICERIDSELSELEIEYPAALEVSQEDPEKLSAHIRDEMRALFTDLKSGQKAQQRQIVSSLSALHAAISDLRSKLPDRETMSTVAPEMPRTSRPHMPIADLARPLVDLERLVDPRPVLAAARAAAARVTDEPAPRSKSDRTGQSQRPTERSYRSVLLGSALLGLMIVIFGREAAQFITASPLTTGAIARP